MQIRRVLNSYSNIIIDSTIKAEIGRTIYYSYFVFKKNILEVLKDLNDEKISINDFWKNLNQKLQKKYSYRVQLFHRFLTIMFNIIDQLNSAYSDNITDKVKIIDNFKTKISITMFQIENELFTFRQDFKNYIYLNTLDCHQTDWDLYLDTSFKGFILRINTSCSKDDCKNKYKIVSNIYYDNHILIDNFLANSKSICSIDKKMVDTRLYNTLKQLKEKIVKKKPLIPQTKYCWNLGDFLISLNVSSDKMIYTVNFDHFYVLLKLRNLEEMIIPFTI